jgi:hypothetical protein
LYTWTIGHDSGGEPADLTEVMRQIDGWDVILEQENLEQKQRDRIRQASRTNSCPDGDADEDDPASSPVKSKSRRRRGRPPDPAVERRRTALIELADDLKPATVRQIFYVATVRGLVEKAETGYDKIGNDLTLLRKNGRLPYGWLAGSTRWQRKPITYAGIQDALEDTANFYRKKLWNDAGTYVEIWLEKDALAGVIFPVTAKYDVPLMIARGYASLSFLHSATEYIAELDRPAFIYHLGDYDPSGQDAARSIEKSLRELAPGAEIYFERLAVTPAQIEHWSLPSRPTKTSDPRAAKFGSDTSVELDAIPPDTLRTLVEDVITEHLPRHQLEVLLEAEKSERSVLLDIVNGLRTVPAAGDA